MQSIQQQFIEFALDANVLRFGEFKTKAGRLSPYFFNAGLFNTGALLDTLGRFYAETLLAARNEGRIEFDMIFGPAYKGIPLAASVATNLARLGCDVPWAFNRKEAKDHGEGGTIVGAPLKGKVVIIDDVISAGTSVRESVAMIQANGAPSWKATRKRPAPWRSSARPSPPTVSATAPDSSRRIREKTGREAGFFVLGVPLQPQPSFLRRSSFTCAGFALPRVFFMH